MNKVNYCLLFSLCLCGLQYLYSMIHKKCANILLFHFQTKIRKKMNLTAFNNLSHITSFHEHLKNL